MKGANESLFYFFRSQAGEGREWDIFVVDPVDAVVLNSLK